MSKRELYVVPVGRRLRDQDDGPIVGNGGRWCDRRGKGGPFSRLEEAFGLADPAAPDGLFCAGDPAVDLRVVAAGQLIDSGDRRSGRLDAGGVFGRAFRADATVDRFDRLLFPPAYVAFDVHRFDSGLLCQSQLTMIIVYNCRE